MSFANQDPEVKKDWFAHVGGAQSFIGQFGYYDDGEEGVIDGKGLASIDPLKGPRYGTRHYTVESYDAPGPDNIRDSDPHAEVSIADMSKNAAPARPDPTVIWHPESDKNIPWADEEEQKEYDNMKSSTRSSSKNSRLSDEFARRKAYAAGKPMRDRARYVDGSGPFLDPSAHGAIRRQLAAAGRAPVTNQSKRLAMSRNSKGSKSGGGGGPRRAYGMSKEQINCSLAPKFDVYPKEEFPLYGRYPPHYSRFLIRNPDTCFSNPEKNSKSTIRQVNNKQSIHNYNHWFPYISHHTNPR
mmetsp:Transcript_18304/g.25713  ORF Transcript_18304/g.25713 Transcript_18304/m.25713 type:complete len:298 (+) Transcript_18304:48-941(+)